MTQRSRLSTIHKPILLLALVAALVIPALAMAFPPKKPYDPRPLMPAVDKRIQGNKYSFIVMGDSKNGSAFDGLIARADALKPAFVWLTGDLTARALPPEYGRLERQLGPFARRVPCWPTPGNHDVGGFRAKQFKYYVMFWGIKEKHWSFDFKNSRFISLWAVVAQPNRSELVWLEQQLKEGKAAGKHLFVCQHMPAYTIGHKKRAEVPNRPTAFTNLMTKYGVVANFSGHDHSYYRTKRDGVNYIIQAIGGAGVYGADRIASRIKGDVSVHRGPRGKMLYRDDSGTKEIPYIGLLTQISIDGDTVTGKTMTSAGKVIDTFTLTGK